MILKIRNVAVIAATLAGCAVGPDYHRPAVVLPAQYDGASVQLGTQINSQWWTLFQDAQLNRLVAEALGHNADLLLAVARMEEADAALRETGATLLPQVNLDVGASRTRASTTTAIPMPQGTPVLRDNRKAALSTAFELDVWGHLRRADEASRARALASRYARDTVRLSVAAQVSLAYLGLRALDVQVAAASASEDAQTRLQQIMESRLSAGTASAVDTLQAANSLALAQSQLAQLRRQRALLEHQLGVLTGQPELKIPEEANTLLPPPLVPPAGLPSALLEARPDVRQAEEALIAANAEVGMIKASLFPTLSLTGSLGTESRALSSLFSTASGAWSVGLGATLPLLDAGRHEAQVDQAKARQRQALAAYQQAVHNAFREVRDSLVSLRETGEVETAQAARLNATEKSMVLVNARFEAGYVAQTQVLEAQRNRDDIRQTHAQARQARLAAAVDLFKALGGGWSPAVR